MPRKEFKLDWVLINQLAIGPAPREEKHLIILEENNIKGILSLCSKEEALPPKNLENKFSCKRIILPDHRSRRLPEKEEIESALDNLNYLFQNPPVFVHCVEAIERSPLICIAWLILKNGLKYEQALRYLMEVHPQTNPLDTQLKKIKEYCVNQS